MKNITSRLEYTARLKAFFERSVEINCTRVEHTETKQTAKALTYPAR